MVAQLPDDALKGYGITKTGLRPEYPTGYDCSKLTSLYASWKDIDGSRRDERHSGVDGGRLGEWIVTPGPGVIRALWTADWGWGKEDAVLVRHARRGLNLEHGPPFYYSAFYHLQPGETRGLKLGQKLERGQAIGRVHRPGNNPIYLPEVHWEVYEVDDDNALEWDWNENDAQFWTNATARLIDPLYMLSRQTPPRDGLVTVQPYIKGQDFSRYRGFTYILPCPRK